MLDKESEISYNTFKGKQYITKGGIHMESKRNLHRYDIIEAEIIMKEISGSIQKKKRPYVIVGNELGTTTAPTVIAMPLTHVIKRKNMPVHGCIEAKKEMVATILNGSWQNNLRHWTKITKSSKNLVI